MSAVGSGGPVDGRNVHRLHSATSLQPRTIRGTEPSRSAGSFHDVLMGRLAGTERADRLGNSVKLSAHAGERLRQAGVHVDARFEERLRSAVDKAAAKGSRSSLVLMDEMALVVSVKNRTVITAVESARMKENVFTNIDSAVIT